jgi:hypothetical protein
MAKTHIAFGDLAETIIDSPDATRSRCSSSAGGGADSSGLLLGSVSQKLVTLAPCIVIVVLVREDLAAASAVRLERDELILNRKGIPKRVEK